MNDLCGVFDFCVGFVWGFETKTPHKLKRALSSKNPKNRKNAVLCGMCGVFAA